MRLTLPPSTWIDDTATEYVAFIEELEHASGLLLAGGIANERMALVILDSLAERLLYEHAERCFSASEAPVAVHTRPFPASRRRSILDDFKAKVALALKDERFFVFIDPLLDEFDAEIFRVAHHYRNAGYHRGTHKAALTEPLGRVYAQAIGRAATRATNHSFRGFSGDEVGILERFDWGAEAESGLLPRSATGPITAAITAPLVVEAEALAERLAKDAAVRLDAVEKTIESLRIDLDKRQIGELVEAAQHWAQHRGDEELHRLARERSGLDYEAEEHDIEVPDELRQALTDNMLKQVARMAELRKTSDVRVGLETVEKLRRRAERLAQKDRVAPVLLVYREIDVQLELLEDALEWVARSWDLSVQQAIDEARGK